MAPGLALSHAVAAAPAGGDVDFMPPERQGDCRGAPRGRRKAEADPHQRTGVRTRDRWRDRDTRAGARSSARNPRTRRGSYPRVGCWMLRRRARQALRAAAMGGHGVSTRVNRPGGRGHRVGLSDARLKINDAHERLKSATGSVLWVPSPAALIGSRAARNPGPDACG
jgi:hypothetical protein